MCHPGRLQSVKRRDWSGLNVPGVSGESAKKGAGLFGSAQAQQVLLSGFVVLTVLKYGRRQKQFRQMTGGHGHSNRITNSLIVAGWRCCAAGRPASGWRCAAGRTAGQRGGEAGWQPGCFCRAASWWECAAGRRICRCAYIVLCICCSMTTSHADLKPPSASALCFYPVIM